MSPRVYYRRHLLRPGGGAEWAVCGKLEPRYATKDPTAADCPACLERYARIEAKWQKHHDQDPHCTCNDCIAHLEGGG
jgi:hypothetical protein